MPIVSGPGTITMPNCAGQLDQKLDKNGDVAGFYTNLTDGPRWHDCCRQCQIGQVCRILSVYAGCRATNPGQPEPSGVVSLTMAATRVPNNALLVKLFQKSPMSTLSQTLKACGRTCKRDRLGTKCSLEITASGYLGYGQLT